MGIADPGTLGLLVLVSVPSSILALILAQWLGAGIAPERPTMVLHRLPETRRYVFRDGYLISDLDDDEYFLSGLSDRSVAWAELLTSLSQLAPGIETDMAALQNSGQSFFCIGGAGPDPVAISGDVEGETHVINVAPAQARGGRSSIQTASLEALLTDLQDMRAALDTMPIAMWRQTADGAITWANGAYLSVLGRGGENEDTLVWPLPPLFDDQLDPPPEPGATRRCRVEATEINAPAWFEVSATPFEDGVIFAAMPIDRLVTAETALRNFVQTLSKTFAHLPIGLAIFDKHRELVLFNPALVTLSTLDPETLSGRPSLFSFLDQLRERQRMPEPKDYKVWRESISALEKAAESGSYQELWTLPTGQTYRVIGRPHPDGAVAFMFEDISSEVSLTRQFRGDLELFQSVLDESDEAIAVFSAEAQLVLSNQRYAEIWGIDPQELLGTLGLIEASRRWQDKTLPTPLWGEIRSFVQHFSERAPWSEHVTFRDGGKMECRVSPLKGGASLVAFRPVSLPDSLRNFEAPEPARQDPPV